MYKHFAIMHGPWCLKGTGNGLIGANQKEITGYKKIAHTLALFNRTGQEQQVWPIYASYMTNVINYLYAYAICLIEYVW